MNEYMSKILVQPLKLVIAQEDTLISTNLPEAFFTYLKVAFLTGIGLADSTTSESGAGASAIGLADSTAGASAGESATGMGLGLAIVKKIVLEHAGSIDVECPKEGGTRFTIRIPIA